MKALGITLSALINGILLLATWSGHINPFVGLCAAVALPFFVAMLITRSI